ncbi:hypothetical protein SMAC4_14171 [Sordaria macrospora]|uniref:uncharacterized protein n=1 Tax=Sordaria macrospora TaxID=5147 RepID=UPI002B27DE72|nr:hypothetical protein SMAC4_13174 [Sordaria macrospora]WPJ62624.1 hypothetical protein SMAC4_13562 [Sordaria macrospora]WPJ62640.1 hypothetical protein SMAC4_13567 [Sordaria macrospora]WPJ64483.1 hypothetical protein SMAC4_13803 [Sordaria macrospora]WPJ65668.1 hypothetical protein SMAC4_13963 [Sordaria macrospora]
MTNLTVQVKKTTSTASTNDKKDSINKNDKDRKIHKQVTCSDCGQSMRDDFKHFPCGHHRNPRTADCWWCDPDKAPANWSKKKEAIEKKANFTNTGTTAAIGATNTSLATPGTTGSALLFGNFGFGGHTFAHFKKDFH